MGKIQHPMFQKSRDLSLSASAQRMVVRSWFIAVLLQLLASQGFTQGVEYQGSGFATGLEHLHIGRRLLHKSPDLIQPREENVGRVLELQQQLDEELIESVTADTCPGQQCCDVELKKKLRQQLGKVVVIVNFNHQEFARNTSAFWRRFYESIFYDVILIGPNALPSIGIESRGHPPHCWSWKNQYWVFPTLMKRYPDADGFLITNDDVAVNYWTFLGANSSKLWMPNDLSKNENKEFPFDPEAPVTEYASNKKLRAKAYAAYNAIPREHRAIYDESTKAHPGHYQKRVMDLFYIPQRLVKPLCQSLIPAFRKAGVPSEIALPTMFYALDHPDYFDHLLDRMVYRWDMYDSRAEVRGAFDPAKHWSADIPALHPWKVSDFAKRARMVQLMSQRDGCLCRRFPDLCSSTM